MSGEPWLIQGEMVGLRRIRQDDIATLCELLDDPGTQWQADAAALLADRQNLAAGHLWYGPVPGMGEIYPYAVTGSNGDALIGEVVLDQIDRAARRARMRMAVLPRFRGRGYGREAIVRVLELAFAAAPAGHNLNRVGVQVRASNARMRAIYEQLGFQEEGVLRDWFPDEHALADAVTLSVLADEFDLAAGGYAPAARVAAE